MNDDIVKVLHLCAEKEERFTSCTSGQYDCPFGETVIDCEIRMKRAAADALSAVYSRIAELEVRLQAYKKHGLEPCDYAGIVASDNRAKKALDDLSVLMKECTRLQAENKVSRELLELAHQNLPTSCVNCAKQEKCATRSGSHRYCWRWQYADRLEALRGKEKSGDA